MGGREYALKLRLREDYGGRVALTQEGYTTL